MLLRQLLDPETSTWTYLVADPATGDAALVDPVLEQADRDVLLLEELGLRLRMTLETHVHADHVTASGALRERLRSEVVVGAATGVVNADRKVPHGGHVALGALRFEARHTPGHTAGCVTWVLHEQGAAFTGDALLVRGCGRTDFQEGDAHALFRSVREQIFTLPDATLLYPGHDYKGRTVTTVAEEKRWNLRLRLGMGEGEFVGIMEKLDLAPPRRIAEVVPANLRSGEKPPAGAPDAVARAVAAAGRQDAELWQGHGI